MLLLADKMDNQRSRYIRALMKPKYKQATSYNIKKIVLVPQHTHMVVQMHIHANSVMQDERTHMLYQFIANILQHFGYTSTIEFVMA